MRLIDADKLIDSFRYSMNHGHETFSVELIVDAIEEQPEVEYADKYRWHNLRENPNDLPELEVGNEYVEVLIEDDIVPLFINFDDVDKQFGYWHDIYDSCSLGYVDSEFKEWEGNDIVFWRYIEYPKVEEW